MSLNSVKYFYFIELMDSHVKINFEKLLYVECDFNIIDTDR